MSGTVFSQDLRLDVREAVVRFGVVRAVDEVSFSVEPGEMFGIIGPNGAGKTTLLSAISGLLPLASGAISIGGDAIRKHRPAQIAALGVGRTFQAPEVFNDFSVLEYMMLGRFTRQSKSIFAYAMQLRTVTRPEFRDRDEALEFLGRYDLASDAHRRLSELPYGLRKLVDLLRTLFGGNRLLLLDEPTSGTASHDRTLLRDVLSAVRSEGVTTVVVDHDVSFVTDLCDRILAMSFGKELGIGTPTEVLTRPDVLAAYVGLEE
jgi:branched-chain amino acid transport system ATP-binding protein